MATTAIYPKIKLTSRPLLGGSVSSTSTPINAHTQPSPTPSKTLPSPTNASNHITLNGTGPGSLRSSDRKRTAPKPFGGPDATPGRARKDGLKDRDGSVDEADLSQQPPRKVCHHFCFVHLFVITERTDMLINFHRD